MRWRNATPADPPAPGRHSQAMRRLTPLAALVQGERQGGTVLPSWQWCLPSSSRSAVSHQPPWPRCLEARLRGHDARLQVLAGY